MDEIIDTGTMTAFDMRKMLDEILRQKTEEIGGEVVVKVIGELVDGIKDHWYKEGKYAAAAQLQRAIDEQYRED